MYTVKLEKFEGPLDVLLDLIQDQELDITQVALAKVTEQYISYIYSQYHKIEARELVDFLVIASKLLLIKSRALLPMFLQEDDDDGYALERQLKIYREYFEASKAIEKLILKKQFCFSRERLSFISNDVAFRPPRSLNAKKIAAVIEQIIADLEPLVSIEKASIKKSVSISEKIEQIQALLAKHSELYFSHVLVRTKNRYEAIVSFLALLELVKQRSVVLIQKGLFEDIEIKAAMQI